MTPLAELRKKMTLRRRVTVLLALLLVLVLVIFGMNFRDRLGLNLFQRFFTYDNEENNITFTHGARGEDLFYGLDYRLLVCSDGALQLFSPTGEQIFREQNSFASPALSSNGKQAVVYDADGKQLYVVAKEKIAFSLEFGSEQYIRAATLNQSGWLAVTTKQPGYRGVIDIYNASYQPVITISLSDYYPVNAVVAPDSKGVYILTEGQNNGVFESRLLYYSFDDSFEDVVPRAQISLGDEVVLRMRSTASRVWVLSDKGIYTLLSSGEQAEPYSFRGDYLKQASLDGSDFAALLLSPSQSGSAGRLVTLDVDGKELGLLELEMQVLAVKAAGRYVGVLTANELLIYNKDLTTLVSSTDQIQGARTFALFADGSLTLISDELARLYIP